MTEREAALQRQYERLRRSVTLFRDLVSTTSHDALYGRLLQGIAKEFPVRAAFVGRFRPLRKEIEVLARVEGSRLRAPDVIPSDHPLVARLLDEPHGAVLVTAADQAPDGFFYKGSRSLLGLRFRLEDDAPDLLVLESTEVGAFSVDDQHFVQDLLQTLQTTLLNRYSRTRADRELDLLLEVAAEDEDVAQQLDESELTGLLHKILEIALSRTQSRTGAVLLADEEAGTLVVEAETFTREGAPSVPRVLHRRADRPSGVVFRVQDDNRPYLANNTAQDLHYVSVFERTRASLGVPMSFQGRSIGVILVEAQTGEHYTPEHQRLLEALASTATRFVRRAQLYRQTRQEGRGVLIKGRGPAWQEVERRIERAAATDATVMLRGESGTGKELVAHAIHFNSSLSKQAFVVVNCAAIPGELLESELFGHAKGAFTGAVAERAGQFEVADGGTIFLDEIGDLPPPLQVKLLRVLQSGEVRKVGSDRVRRVSVRIIAATSRALESMMAEGTFREDLYYRLMVVPVYLPPLRSYPDSLPSMATQFLRDANVRYGRSFVGFAGGALDALRRHGWPGNVRELRNVVEQAVLMADGSEVGVGDLPAYLRGEAPAPPMPRSGAVAPVRALPPSADPGIVDAEAALWDYKALKAELVRRFEERYLDALLSATGGNVTRAAELAGLHRVNLHRMLRRQGAGE